MESSQKTSPSAVTTAMRAIVQDKFGSPNAYDLREIPRPIPNDDEVLVRVVAAGVNPADWHYMTGTPYLVRIGGGGLRKPKKSVPGIDLAGVVEVVGESVTNLHVGDEVFGEAGGGFAEFAAVRASRLAPKPTNMTFEQAAAVPIAALTALQGLRDRGELKKGQKVLINGASGGVGTFAVQIAKALGAEVTGVCGTGNLELVRSIGADHVIDYTKEDFTKSGQRYDLILDTHGHHGLRALKRAMTDSGIYVGVGGPKKSLSLLWRMAKMATVSLAGKKKMHSMLAKQTQEDLKVLREFMESGAVTPVIDRTYPLAEASEALQYQGTGHASGKTVVVVSTPKEA